MKITESDCRMMNKTGPSELRRSKRLIEKDLREKRLKTDFMTKLPQEMTIEILGRLSIKNIIRCKCVCKSWRNIIGGDSFATSYTLNSRLVCVVHRDNGFAICRDQWTPLFRFGLPHAHYPVIIDSANGLLLLGDGCANTLFICNPMAREYAELPLLPARSCFFGFGVGKLTGKYKILCGDQFRSYYVFTLGEEEGLWRSITTPPCITVPRDYAASLKGLAGYDFQRNLRICWLDNLRLSCDYAVFLNGSLHWLEYDFKKNLYVCCFDLDTELFTGFSLPDYGGGKYSNYRLCILEGKLCFCNLLENLDVVIWWMNNYGDENSWIKIYTIFTGTNMYGLVYPLKIFPNGNLLLTKEDSETLFIYLKNIEDPYNSFTCPSLLERPSNYHYYSKIIIYTPGFLSLKTMGIHNVQSLSLYPLRKSVTS